MKQGWKYKKLGEICRFFSGFAFKSNKFTKNGMPIIRISDIQNGEINDTNVVYFNPSDYEQDLSRYIIYPGEILIAMSGGTTGKIGKNKTSKEFYLNQRVGAFRENKSIIEHDYLFYYLLTKSKESLRIAAGAAQPNLSSAQINNFIIPVPPISEQERIVERLDAAFAQIDELKSNAERQLAEARALFQSALTQAMQPKPGWQEKTLGEIATDMYRGSGIRRDQITKEGIPCVRYGEIYTTYNISFEDCVSHTLESSIASPKYFEHGDLLFAITGESVEDIGKTIAYMGNEKCLLGGDIICMKHNQNPKFLSYALSTTDAIKQKGLGKTKLKVVHTNAPSLKAIRIPLPPLSEQQSIVEQLDSISTNISLLEEINQKIKPDCDAMKQALLRQIFE